MEKAKLGDTVRVHYTGKLGDGTVFDSSREREPLEFTLGEGRVIAGFENSVVGMAPGETKTETIPAALAYGERREELVFEIERDRIPPHIDPEVGKLLEIAQPDGQSFPVKVTEVTETAVTLDANHPLAGEDLTFEIELVEII